MGSSLVKGTVGTKNDIFPGLLSTAVVSMEALPAFSVHRLLLSADEGITDDSENLINKMPVIINKISGENV